MSRIRIPTALSIAGSDSGGGAGIQADLKAFARCGVHGMTAITAITAQNTRAVEAVEPVSPRMIFNQMLAVAEDRGTDAVKIGMVGSPEAIDAIAVGLTYLGIAFKPVVIDPVMVAESGAELLDQETKEGLVEYLLPKADVITPNIPEARALTGLKEAGQEDLARAVFELTSRELGQPQAVVVTGGHSEELVDVFFDGEEVFEIHGEKHPGGSAHGSGCTHSSALAAFLAHGDKPLEAACKARTVAAEAVAAGLHEVGSGPGPVDVLGVRGRGADVAPAPASALRRR